MPNNGEKAPTDEGPEGALSHPEAEKGNLR